MHNYKTLCSLRTAAVSAAALAYVASACCTCVRAGALYPIAHSSALLRCYGATAQLPLLVAQ
eukprot:16839-Heterococcus_DN1.PRE.2